MDLNQKALELNQQVQSLIDNTPPNSDLAQVLPTIAPSFLSIASQLQHLQYYIVQTLDESWVTLTLENQNDPNQQKTVVYAFPNLEDATASATGLRDPQLMALPLPAIDILFRMLAMSNKVDSVIFLEVPGSRSGGAEVRQVDLQRAVQLRLQSAADPLNPGPSTLISDIA